jgi:O-antigen/teichoic acid export membrane protein
MSEGGSSGKRKVVLTFLDQGVSSGTNFLLAALVARLLDFGGLGAYGLTLTVWFAVLGIHRALVAEPIVIGTRSGHPDEAVLQRGFSAEVVLGLGLGIVVACGSMVALALDKPVIARTLAVLALVLVPLLLQDLWRFMAFFEGRPDRALANDLVFAVVQISLTALLIAGGHESTPLFVAAWGAGAAAGAVFGFRQFRVRPRLMSGWRQIGEHWGFSRWMLADFGTSFTMDNVYPLMVLGLLGDYQFGVLQGVIRLMGPAAVILQSGGNLGVPGASRALRDRGVAGLDRFARKLTIGIGACMVAYVAVVFVAGSWLLRTVYNKPEAVGYGNLMRLVGLGYVIWSGAFGAGIALRVVQQTRRLWAARLAVSAISFVAAYVLIRRLGIDGSGWAAVITAGAGVVAVSRVWTTARDRVARDQRGPTPAVLSS